MDQPLDNAWRLQFWSEDPRVLGIVQNVADGVIGIDARAHVEFMNPAAERLFGYAAGEVIGRNVKMLMPDVYGEHHDAYIENYLCSGQRHIIGVGREVSGKCKDGTVFPMYLSVGEVLLPGYRGFIGIVHDLTAQKAAERDLRDARELLQSILDSMPSILIGIDSEGLITQWNQAAERETGSTAAVAMNRPVTELFPVLQSRCDAILGAVQSGASITWQRLPLSSDGTTRYFDLLVYPIKDAEGAAVLRMDDVSERVRIEEMMVQTEKMMSVGGLAAGMAHEINNPLGIVSQACQNLHRRIAQDLPENLRVAEELGVDLDAMRHYLEQRGIFRFIDGMREATERASRIVSDMLAYSRRSASSFVPARVNTLIDASLRLAGHDYDLKKSYDFRRIQIERIGEQLDDEILCDEMAIEQVLLNLLRNAAQAMAQAPSEQTPAISLEVYPELEWVRLEVADNGPGMPDDIARRLFEPFFTTKPVGVGTGLGLSVAYFIVTEQHRGTIAVRTAPQQGTRFIIRLPRSGRPHASFTADSR